MCVNECGHDVASRTFDPTCTIVYEVCKGLGGSTCLGFEHDFETGLRGYGGDPEAVNDDDYFLA